VSDQAAFQEVDDAVRQDDIKAWWKRWGTPLIVGFVLLIAVTVAVMQWRKYEDGQRAIAGAAFSAVIAKIGQDNTTARAELERQAREAPDPYRWLAALAAAQLLDKTEDQVAALQVLAPKLPPEFSDLSQVIAGYKSVDAPNGEQIVANLEPLTGPERAFRVSVRELRALVARRKGDAASAREIWAEISRDPGSPQGTLQRAQAMLNFYGPGEDKSESKEGGKPAAPANSKPDAKPVGK
jgi:hypothetical protein